MSCLGESTRTLPAYSPSEQLRLFPFRLDPSLQCRHANGPRKLGKAWTLNTEWTKIESVTHYHEEIVVKPANHGIYHFFEHMGSQRAERPCSPRCGAQQYQCHRFLAVPVHWIRSRILNEVRHGGLAASRRNSALQQWPLGSHCAGQSAGRLLSLEESRPTFRILGGITRSEERRVGKEWRAR